MKLRFLPPPSPSLPFLSFPFSLFVRPTCIMHRPCPSPAPGPPAQTDSRTTSSCGPLRARSGTSKVTISCHCTLIQLILWRCKCVEGTNLSIRPLRIVWRLSSFPFEEDIFRIPAPPSPDPFQVIHFSTLPCLPTPIGLSLSLCRVGLRLRCSPRESWHAPTRSC